MRTRPDIHEDLVLAEASAWLTRLQGSARTPAAERAFRAWLAEDKAHARAFARVNHAWDIIPGAAAYHKDAARPPSQRRRQQQIFAVAASIALFMVLAGGYALRDPVYRTGVGEQKALTLDDGSRITLNTDTQLVVSYRKSERHIRLERGEAMFEVAKNPQRPFIVTAGREQVRALGTTFLVRNDADQLAVLLIEGRVEVSEGASQHSDKSSKQAVTLAPGERLVLSPSNAKQALDHLKLDHPKVEEATAWRQGEVIFDNTTLGDAAAELNRYASTHLHLDDPSLAQLRVSGVFATRDPVEFANAVAKLHDLNVVQTEDGVVLKEARRPSTSR
jgi:transmembrane sensor